jgi:adenylate cyclase
MEMITQVSRDAHGFDRGIELEEKSIALDKSNAAAYAILSEFYAAKGQFDLSLATVQRALALEPNSALAYSALAVALTCSGKPAEAVVAAQKATRLDPVTRDYYGCFEGVAYLFMRRYGEAVPLLQRGVARYPNVISLRLYLITCYVELGRTEEARAEAAEIMRINPQFSLAKQQQMGVCKELLEERDFADLRKVGLK